MPLLYAWTHGVLNTHVQRTGPFYAVTLRVDTRSVKYTCTENGTVLCRYLEFHAECNIRQQKVQNNSSQFSPVLFIVKRTSSVWLLDAMCVAAHFFSGSKFCQDLILRKVMPMKAFFCVALSFRAICVDDGVEWRFFLSSFACTMEGAVFFLGGGGGRVISMFQSH